MGRGRLHGPTQKHTQCLIDTELNQIHRRAFHGDVSVEDAQNHILTVYANDSIDDRAPLILRELLNVLPREGKRNLSRDIVGKDEGVLTVLVSDIKTFLIAQLKVTGGQTPTVSEESSEESGGSSAGENGRQEDSLNELEKQSILKTQCLRRDRNRCVITDLYDYDEFWKLDKKQQAGIRDSRTECAHIIPYSAAPAWTDHGVDLEDAQEKSKTWALLYRYFPKAREIIAPESINSHRNAMTMMPSLHTEFGEFNFGFSHKGDNRYEIVTFERLPGTVEDVLKENQYIKIRTETDIDVPDPMLLEIHLAICKVLHATGIAGQIDDYLRDPEDDEVPVASKLHVAEWIMSLA